MPMMAQGGADLFSQLARSHEQLCACRTQSNKAKLRYPGRGWPTSGRDHSLGRIIHTDGHWRTRMPGVPDSENKRISSVPHIAPVEQMAGEDDDGNSTLYASLMLERSQVLRSVVTLGVTQSKTRTSAAVSGRLSTNLLIQYFRVKLLSALTSTPGCGLSMGGHPARLPATGQLSFNQRRFSTTYVDGMRETPSRHAAYDLT